MPETIHGRFWTLNEVAADLGINYRTAHAWYQFGRLPLKKVLGVLVIEDADYQVFKQNRGVK